MRGQTVPPGNKAQMTFVPEPNLASVVLSRLSSRPKSTGTDLRKGRGLRWQFPRGILYDHPTKPRRFVANEKARDDPRWWHSLVRGAGLVASRKFVANDFWNFEVIGLLESLYHRAVCLEPFRAELETRWTELSHDQTHPVEFHPSNFWFLNHGVELEYLPGLTDLYWSPDTPWSKVWEDFQPRASIGPNVGSYDLEDFPQFSAPRYCYRGEPSTFGEYISRGVIERDVAWPTHWEFYPNEPRLVSPVEANLANSNLELRYPVQLPTGPLACWNNLRRAIVLGGHPAPSLVKWLGDYLSLLNWVERQPEALWSDFVPPYFLWEDPYGRVLPGKVVLGLFAPAEYKGRAEGLIAMVRGWTRCLLFSLPQLNEPKLTCLLNRLLDTPVEPSAATVLWESALKHTRFATLA